MSSNPPAPRRPDQLILEGIVTTRNKDGSVNVSPMGPVVDGEVNALRLRPFSSSTTYQNLKRNRVGVFHVTDDVDLLARAATGTLVTNPEMLDDTADGLVIANACRWYAFEVSLLDDSQARVEIECSVTERGRLRDFLGWNRAMHSVLEAAILATRVGLLPMEEILSQMKPLKAIVDKTGSEKELACFQFLSEYINASADDLN